RQYGVGTAINVGDYLIGLGYRLVGRERKELGGDCAADILNRLADAHLKLSEGQGAELLWRDSADKALTALDALKIYALKTAPAFPAALVERVRRLFERAQVFARAEKLVEKYRARAEAVADDVQPAELRELLYYLVDSVLDRQPPPPPEPGPLPLVQLSLP